MASQPKIALLQLYSNGDCLFATVVARQIKTDFPGSHLTWYIAKQCKGMIVNNPDIDEIVEIDLKDKNGIQVWKEMNTLLLEKKRMGVYDEYFSSQLVADNERNYTGSIRSSVFKNYPKPITVDIKPNLFLGDTEVQRVKHFVESNQISRYKKVVLFECAPVSGQAAINPKIATQICEELLSNLTDVCFILTSGEKIVTTSEHIFDASTLTIRENAELINHCTHLIGCSSGISWISTSTWSKQIPTLQLMNNSAFYFNSMCRDFSYLNQDSAHIIEIAFTPNFDALKQIMGAFLENFDEAKKAYHQVLADRSTTVYSLARRFIIEGKFGYAMQVFKHSWWLNRTNYRYYLKGVKMIVLMPFFVFLNITNAVKGS